MDNQGNNLSNLNRGELEAEAERLQGKSRWWLIRAVALPVILSAVGLIIMFVKKTPLGWIFIGLGIAAIPISIFILLNYRKQYSACKARLDELKRKEAADRSVRYIFLLTSGVKYSIIYGESLEKGFAKFL